MYEMKAGLCYAMFFINYKETYFVIDNLSHPITIIYE